jgi:hypothetical protein
MLGAEGGQMAKLVRGTQVALILNAVLHGLGSAGFALGFGPHAAGEAHMGRRAASAGLAAIVMFVVVARRLARDAGLIVIPLAFVLSQLATSIFELVRSGDPKDLAPVPFEAAFAVIYSVFLVRVGRRGASAPGGAA